jgi:hypothetical protein
LLGARQTRARSFIARPDNSSVPPSQARKPNRAERRAANKRKGRPGVFRALAPNPDRIIESVVERCPHGEHTLTPADQSGFHAYDHIELPPIHPAPRRADVPARESGHGAAHHRPVDKHHAAGEWVNPAGIERRQRARRA